MKSLLLIVSVIFLSGGCAHAPKKSAAQPQFQVSGELVDGPRLKTGGKLGLAMFKAGPQAEAGDQLDRISLMLLKGIRERLQQNGTALVLTTEEEQADLILQGYVEKLFQPGKFDRWVKHKKHSQLSVSGEIWQKQTGTKVLTFASSQDISLKDKSLDVAYHMGEAIGNFVLGQAAKAGGALPPAPLLNLQQDKRDPK